MAHRLKGKIDYYFKPTPLGDFKEEFFLKKGEKINKKIGKIIEPGLRATLSDRSS